MPSAGCSRAARLLLRAKQLLASSIAALLLATGSCATAAAAPVSPPAAASIPAALQLNDSLAPLDAQEFGRGWIDATSNSTLEQVMQPGVASFQPTRPDLIYALGEPCALWLHYRLQRGRTDRVGWLLTVPMPAIDSVTVYQQDVNNRWVGHSAGDTLAVASWPEAGRYPAFRLDLPAGQPRDVYVRIKHYTAANFPVQLMSATAYDQHVQIEYLGLGLVFGALVLLIAACLAQSLAYRDTVYAWYALYAFLTTLCVAAYTGVAGHLLWPSFGALGDAIQPILALLASASALLFVRNLTGISARYPLIDKGVYWFGLAGIVAAAAYPVLPRGVALAMMAAYSISVTLTAMGVAWAAWRRGDVVGVWVLCAYVPITIAVVMAMLRPLGYLAQSFATQYAIAVAMAIEVPLLLVALNIRSRERHGAQIRELALSTQDALTGLLAPHLFHDRLRQVVTRFRRDRESAAVVFIDLVNYQRIKEHYGSAVAEQSLLRSVIKLRRLLRDVDTVSRVGEARFGLILEGVRSRVAVTDRAARLIAAGLMPLAGLKPDVTLQFHIGAVLLEERVSDAPDLVDALDELLASMSERTRRPIRFLEPEVTQPAPLEADSALPGEADSLLPTEVLELGPRDEAAAKQTATRH
ncbi:sensor domain-containing diguanylate cyclase [Caenimonas koreensis]|nr:7TM diverse intracellular signaling domain-containing protein [Caenimonas koreensis]